MAALVTAAENASFSQLKSGKDVPPSSTAIPEGGYISRPSPDLPIIDLGAAPGSAQGDVASAMVSAGKEWGVFQVVNHGVPLELLERMASLQRDFYGLPTEQKMRVSASNQVHDGYSCHSGFVNMEGITLMSILSEPSKVEEFASKVWPGGNAAFCETTSKVMKELEAVQNRILQLLAEGLGLPTNFFSHHFEKKGGQPDTPSSFRSNYYPPCADLSRATDTTKPHTDSSILTLLYQDTGNGLHILDKEQTTWHLVEHRKDGIIVFVNDVLQGWTNGVLQAAIHRVVLSHESRVSFLLSSCTPMDMLIQPAALPVGESGDCRPRYKPFTSRQYFDSLPYYGNMQIEKGRKGIEHFFLIDQPN